MAKASASYSVFEIKDGFGPFTHAVREKIGDGPSRAIAYCFNEAAAGMIVSGRL